MGAGLEGDGGSNDCSGGAVLLYARVYVCVQAEQVVPDFLEQIAATAYGSSFGTSMGEFGSTDTRVS